MGVTGLTGFDNTRDDESRRASAVRGDNADGSDVGGIP